MASVTMPAVLLCRASATLLIVTVAVTRLSEVHRDSSAGFQIMYCQTLVQNASRWHGSC